MTGPRRDGGGHNLLNRPGAGGGAVSNIGVRGESIGFKVIDWVPMITVSKVRL